MTETVATINLAQRPGRQSQADDALNQAKVLISLSRQP